MTFLKRYQCYFYKYIFFIQAKKTPIILTSSGPHMRVCLHHVTAVFQEGEYRGLNLRFDPVMGVIYKWY